MHADINSSRRPLNTTNKYITVTLSCMVFWLWPQSGEADVRGAQTQPNIILIIGDDISPDFSCYGGQVLTPNIDQLAKDGVRFDNAYVTASSCSPSRCSIITGRYPHNTGAPELHMDLPAGQYLFPLALKESGYYTLQAGKWHMGNYPRIAFDKIYDDSYAIDPTGSARWVQALQERPKDKPFFMWFASLDAHRPWEPDPEAEPYDPKKMILPAGIPDTPKSRADLASYCVEVHRFDRYIGKVVTELKNQDIYNNTLIIIIGDNGRPFPRNKTTLYDNGMKTPLVVHWPNGNLKKGLSSKSFVSTIDIAPAILEAARLPVPQQVQGINFLPIARQPDLKIREVVFGERNWHTQRNCERMVRHGDWIYFRNFTPNSYSFLMVSYNKGAYAELLRLKAENKLTPEQAQIFSTNNREEYLFNVTKDPQQLNNLAADNKHTKKLKQLRELLTTWQQQTGDAIPAIGDMTPDRHNRQTYESLYTTRRPPEKTVPGQQANATKINHPGPIN